MVDIDISKLPYGRTLEHIGNILVGTVFVCAAMYYDPHFWGAWAVLRVATASQLLALSVPALIIAYVTGSLLLLVSHSLLSVAWDRGQAYSIRMKKGAGTSTISMPSSWKKLAVAVLSRAGVQSPEETEWSDWLKILYGVFVAEEMSARASKYAITFSVGMLLAGLMVLYRNARTVIVGTVSAVAMGVVLYRAWNLGRGYAEFQSSWSEQAVYMMQSLLDSTKKQDAEKEKATAKGAET